MTEVLTPPIGHTVTAVIPDSGDSHGETAPITNPSEAKAITKNTEADLVEDGQGGLKIHTRMNPDAAPRSTRGVTTFPKVEAVLPTTAKSPHHSSLTVKNF